MQKQKKDQVLRHVKNEFEILGAEEKIIDTYLEIVGLIYDLESSGYPLWNFMKTLKTVLNLKNLSPLTDDPKEWEYVNGTHTKTELGLWRNIRNYNVLSEDGGRTYFFTEDVVDNFAQRAYFRSIPKEEKE